VVTLLVVLQQVLEFFSYLTTAFGNNIQIILKPTNDGINVGLQWRFGKHAWSLLSMNHLCKKLFLKFLNCRLGQDTPSPLEGFQLTHKPLLPRESSNKVCLIMNSDREEQDTKFTN